jgi:hypothetical protein
MGTMLHDIVKDQKNQLHSVSRAPIDLLLEAAGKLQYLGIDLDISEVRRNLEDEGNYSTLKED